MRKCIYQRVIVRLGLSCFDVEFCSNPFSSVCQTTNASCIPASATAEPLACTALWFAKALLEYIYSLFVISHSQMINEVLQHRKLLLMIQQRLFQSLDVRA